MFRDRFLKRIFMFVFFAALVFPTMLKQLGTINPMNPMMGTSSQHAPQLTEKRREHMLHGDQSGGGHLHGTGAPCKSEFPASWNEDKIVTTVTQMAANDNLGWQQQKNGNYVAEANEGQVRVRVVLNSNRTQIITAYPVNMPLNPCNRGAANDNNP